VLEELAVGAQHHIPYVHVLVNNSYPGLIRQAPRGFDIDFQVHLEFENIDSPELGAYGVDHVKVAEGLGRKALRVTEPDGPLPAFEEAKKLAAPHRVPVVVEALLERLTDVSMAGASTGSPSSRSSPPRPVTRRRRCGHSCDAPPPPTLRSTNC
jgi:tartronate-semialdehyde synthase